MEALFESLQNDPYHYVISALVFLAYWTLLESRSGQSIGKKVMNLKTTTLDGFTRFTSTPSTFIIIMIVN